MNQTQMYADQAVFTLQLRSAEAIRYISKNAGVDVKTAEAALKSVVTFHKVK